jgi:7 transmembrane receptor (rhodopsin family)
VRLPFTCLYVYLYIDYIPAVTNTPAFGSMLSYISMNTSSNDSQEELSTWATFPFTASTSDYDVSANSSFLLDSLGQFYFQCAVLFIGVIGTAANGFVLFVLATSKQLKRHVMNYLVLNQLALDLFSSVVLVITYALNVSQMYLVGPAGDWLCNLLLSEMMLFIGLNGSSINLALISIERHVKIVYPLWHKKRFRPAMALAAIACSWMMSVLTNCIYVPLTTAVVDGQCMSVVFWTSNAAQRTFGTWYFVTFFGFPVISFVYCYGRILHVVRRRRKRIGDVTNSVGHRSTTTNESSTGESTSDRLQMNAVKTMTILTLFFAVSCVPCVTFVHLFASNVVPDRLLAVGAFFAVSWMPNNVYYLFMNIVCDLPVHEHCVRLTCA